MSEIKVGDKVSWTHTSSSGRSISMSLREGVVVEIGPKFAKVKTSSKRIVELALSSLRVRGQKSEITEFVENMREGNK